MLGISLEPLSAQKCPYRPSSNISPTLTKVLKLILKNSKHLARSKLYITVPTKRGFTPPQASLTKLLVGKYTTIRLLFYEKISMLHEKSVQKCK